MSIEPRVRDESLTLNGLRFHFRDWGDPAAPPIENRPPPHGGRPVFVSRRTGGSGQPSFCGRSAGVPPPCDHSVGPGTIISGIGTGRAGGVRPIP